ncbi:hypothetical protein CRUP_018207 [Coryphaenoides rupestris]|nr:hypothetical protein CRUP_018207 [Coryphaenoides rupestris]
MVVVVVLQAHLHKGLQTLSRQTVGESSAQNAFMIQYFERRMTQLEERLNQCELSAATMTQRFYDLTSEIRGQLSTGELEYLENKIPAPQNIEIEEALLEQQSLKIVKKVGDAHGSWFKDPSTGSSKVYFLSGLRNDTLLEFPSVKSFTESRSKHSPKVVKLPSHWQGTGHMVYKGFLYYHKADTPNQIVKVRLPNGTQEDTMLLPGAGRLPAYNCSTALNAIKSLKIVKKVGDAHGSWFKDPSTGSSKVYFLSGLRNDTLLEFPSVKSFTESRSKHSPKVVKLPSHWQGTGHVVYKGFLYYHKADTPNQIVKVRLPNGTQEDTMLLPGAGRLPAYSLNPNTYIDLAVDELGLWVIHTDPDYSGNLVITKLDTGESCAVLPQALHQPRQPLLPPAGQAAMPVSCSSSSASSVLPAPSVVLCLSHRLPGPDEVTQQQQQHPAPRRWGCYGPGGGDKPDHHHQGSMGRVEKSHCAPPPPLPSRGGGGGGGGGAGGAGAD